jgi:hypothetical protein
MARILGLFPAALVAAKNGYNATQFYNALRAAGEAPRQSEAYKLFGIAKASVAKAADEPFRQLGSVPTAEELSPWATKTGTGVSQRVLMTYRDRATGAIVQTYYTVKSERGVTRESAIASAISSYASNAEQYNQDLIGAIHMAAYQLIPFTA